MAPIRSLAFLSILTATACGDGGPPPATAADADNKSSVERFMPFKDGHVYSYETRAEGQPGQGLLIVNVLRPRDDMAEFKMGAKTKRFVLEADGIRELDGGYVLKAPLKAGATFKGTNGTVTVSSTTKSVTVPAGTFKDCVETVEEAKTQALERKVTTTYCPDVGITNLHAEAIVGDDLVVEDAVLKTFGPKVDINDAPPPPE